MTTGKMETFCNCSDRFSWLCVFPHTLRGQNGIHCTEHEFRLVRKHMNESEGFVFTCTTVTTLVINLQNSYQRECQRVGTTGHVTSLTATLSDCIQTVLQGGHANTSQLCQVLLKNILLLAGNMNAFFMTNRLNKSTYAWWWEEFKLLFILTQQRSDSVTPLPEKTEKRGVRENRLVINRAVMHKLSGPAL